MHPSSFRYACIAMVALAVEAMSPAVGQTPPPAGAPAAPAGVTGKERLGDKWTDEQRVDNCKVPPDKRGTKPRPDTCSDALTH
jgi:hypothetical protein